MTGEPGTGLVRLRATSVGTLTPGTLAIDQSIIAVVGHIVEGLERLSERSASERLPEHETGLTQALVTELERCVGDRPYFFQKEWEEIDSGRSPRADVVAQAKDDHPAVLSGSLAAGGRFFAIEAKRLPAPRSDREREYVSGARGALERFKRGVHGRGLRFVGVIAYVQGNDFTFWRETINGWIDDLMRERPASLLWEEGDKLGLESSTARSARLRSTSRRHPDDALLTVFHVWVQLAQARGRGGRAPARKRRG